MEVVEETAVEIQQEISAPEQEQKKIAASPQINSIVFELDEGADLNKSILMIDGIEQKLYSHLFTLEISPGEHEIEYILMNESGDVMETDIQKIGVEAQPIELSVTLSNERNSPLYYLGENNTFYLEGSENIEKIAVTADGKEIKIQDNSFVLDESVSLVRIQAWDRYSQIKEIQFECRPKPNLEIHLANPESGFNKFYLTDFDSESYPLYLENKDQLEEIQRDVAHFYEWKDLNTNTFNVKDEFGNTVQTLELKPIGSVFDSAAEEKVPVNEIKPVIKPAEDAVETITVKNEIQKAETPLQNMNLMKPTIKPAVNIKLKINDKQLLPKKIQTFHTLPDIEVSSDIQTNISYEINGKQQNFSSIENALSSLNEDEILDIKIASADLEISSDSKTYSFQYKPIEATIQKERKFNYEESQISLKKDKELVFNKNKSSSEDFEIKVTKHFNSIEEETVYEKDTVRIWLKQMDPNNPVEFTQLVINGNPILKNEIKRDSLNQPYYEVKVKDEPYHMQIKAADKLGNEVSKDISFDAKPNSGRIFRWAFYFVLSILSGWLFKSRKRTKRVYYSNWKKGY